MAIAPERVARTYVPTGSVWDLARNRDVTTGVGKLIAQDVAATTDRPGVWLQWEMLAGWPVDYGTVADEAAMIALHSYADSALVNPIPRYIAPGDSCLRADDPGWRWHCIAGHGLALADWERRPLAEALEGFAAADHEHAIADVTGLADALDAKQTTPANAAALANITESGGTPLWYGSPWPVPGGGGVTSLDDLLAPLPVAAWYAADDGCEEATGDPCETGDTVARWLDKSGNDVHLEQSTAGYKPTWVSGVIAGRPVVRFDGDDDHLIGSTFPSIGLADCTIIFVAAAVASANYSRLAVIGASGTGADYNSAVRIELDIGSGADSYRINASGLSLGLAVGRPAPLGVYAVRVYRNVAKISVDDAARTVENRASFAASLPGLLIGAYYDSGISTAYCFEGDLAEMVIIDSGLGDGQLGQIVGAMRAKYGI